MELNLGKSKSPTLEDLCGKEVTAKELAAKLEVSTYQISRLKNGTHCGMLIAAIRVARHFDMSVEELFGYLSPPTSSSLVAFET